MSARRSKRSKSVLLSIPYECPKCGVDFDVELVRSNIVARDDVVDILLDFTCKACSVVWGRRLVVLVRAVLADSIIYLYSADLVDSVVDDEGGDSAAVDAS